MAEGPVNSAQQAQDAQNLDDLTSLQQTGAEGGQAAGGVGDAEVNVSNPPQQNDPSLYHDNVVTNDEQEAIRSRNNDTNPDGTPFVNNTGRAPNNGPIEDLSANNNLGDNPAAPNNGGAQPTATQQAAGVNSGNQVNALNQRGLARPGDVAADQSNATSAAVQPLASTPSDAQRINTGPTPILLPETDVNSAPVASSASVDVDEDAIISGRVSAIDADAGETASLIYALVDAAPTGLTFNADGTYSFDASSYDRLSAGEQLVLTIPYNATDVNGAKSSNANLVITVIGTNDGAVIDGYVKDALVFLDADGDKVWDIGESWARTDASGAFNINYDNGVDLSGLNLVTDGRYYYDAATNTVFTDAQASALNLGADKLVIAFDVNTGALVESTLISSASSG